MKKSVKKSTGEEFVESRGEHVHTGGRVARRVALLVLMLLVCAGGFYLGSLYWWGDINAEEEFIYTVEGLDAELLKGAKITLTYEKKDDEDAYEYEETKTIEGETVEFALTQDGKYVISITDILGYEDKKVEPPVDIQRYGTGSLIYDAQSIMSNLDPKTFPVSVVWNGEDEDVKETSGFLKPESPSGGKPCLKGDVAYGNKVDLTIPEKKGYVVEWIQINGTDLGDIEGDGNYTHSSDGIEMNNIVTTFIHSIVKNNDNLTIEVKFASKRPDLEITGGKDGAWTNLDWEVTGKVLQYSESDEIHAAKKEKDLPIICLTESQKNAFEADPQGEISKYLKAGEAVNPPYKISHEGKGFPITFANEGENTYWLYAADPDENPVAISEPEKITVKIDREKPKLTSHAFYPAGDDKEAISAKGGIYWHYSDITLQGEFEDALSGVKAARLYRDKKLYDTKTFDNPLKKGELSFSLKAEDFHEVGTVRIELEDAAGNISEQMVGEEVYIQSTEPEIRLDLPEGGYQESGEDGKRWYRRQNGTAGTAKVRILPGREFEIAGKGVIRDEKLNLSGKVVYKIGDSRQKEIDSASLEREGEEYSFDLPISDLEWVLQEGRNQITVTAGNSQARSKTETFAFYLDDSKPSLAKSMGIIFTKVNSQEYGSFSNKMVEIAVYPADLPQTLHSGIKEVRVREKDINGGAENVLIAVEDGKEPGKYCVTVPQENLTVYHKEISVEIEDQVGNESERLYPNELNSNIKSQDLMYEVVAPAIEISLPDGVKNADNKLWYGKNENIPIKVTDGDSGLRSISVTMNGSLVGQDAQGAKILTPVDSEERQSKEETYEINTNQVERKSDGSCQISIQAIDNAGNVKMESRTVYIDTTAPEIIGFHFEGDKKADGRPGFPNYDSGKNVEVTKYGYYFKKNVKVTIYAQDLSPSAGMKNISWFKVNEKGQELDQDGNSVKEKGKGVKVEQIGDDGSITITVKAKFKGRIFAKVTDQVGHQSAYRGPDGTVVERKGDHKDEGEHISVKIQGSGKGYRDIVDADYQSDGTIYPSDKNLSVRVRDEYAGIREIMWSVTADYDKSNDEVGILTVDSAGKIKQVKYTGKEKSVKKVVADFNKVKEKSPENARKVVAKGLKEGKGGWKDTKNGNGKGNLVIQLNRTFQVKHNSNGIKVWVRMEDWAGNASVGRYQLDIDKTVPKMVVTYDNKTHDGQYKDFYKGDRVATVSIRERNFDPEKFRYKIDNTDGVIPKLGEWSTTGTATINSNKKNPDETLHVAKIRFSADGDYTFSATFEDEAGNQAKPIRNQKFTIDKTLPKVSVSYDLGKEKASNGNYFAKERTATVTVQEHNFDPARVQIKGVGTEGGKAVPFPALSSWGGSGDTHVATIRYADNGKYTFDIAVRDKAGNESADYPEDQFYVDQKGPKITIEGVEHKHAYNDEGKNKMKPVITCTDTNYDETKVRITLEGVNNGEKGIERTVSPYGSGQRFEIKDFPKEKKWDDIYTLKVEAEDKAGNKTEYKVQTEKEGGKISKEDLTFSVNRFGSVYIFSDKLNDMKNKYVPKGQEVRFTETNVSPLEKGEIVVKMTRNGIPKILEQGKDYDIDPQLEDREWNKHSSSHTYRIYDTLFQKDGKYTVAIYSEDKAGNINENVDEYRKNEIEFGVDKTKPRVMAVNFEEGGQYEAEKMRLQVAVKDNLVLEDVKIKVNGEEVSSGDLEKDGEDYFFYLDSSNSSQKVEVEAKDQAGNSNDEFKMEGILVSKDPLVRWRHNNIVYFGIILGLLLIAGIAVVARIAVKGNRRASS